MPVSVVLPASPRVFFRRSVVALVLGLLGATVAAAGQDDPPVPAPGQIVPPHAAGGWPKSTSGDDAKPKRTAEQQARLDEVTNELKRLAETYGPDSVVLQSKLLIRSMAAGALGPTEVRVAGPSATAGPDHLEIDVETGLFFDEATTTADSRRDSVWKDVAAPVLDEMVSFKIEPSALELVFLFDVQDAASRGGAPVPEPSAPARHEAFRARLSREILDDLAGDQATADAVKARAVLTPAAESPRVRDFVSSR